MSFSEKRYETMQYRRCGHSGLKLPVLSLGCWHNFGGHANHTEAKRMLRRAFDLGITHFDFANNYGPPPGSAESFAGKVLAEDFVKVIGTNLSSPPRLATACGSGLMANGVRTQISPGQPRPISFDRLGLNYVDIFYSHRPDPDTPLEETIGALDSANPSGKSPLRWHQQLQWSDDRRGREGSRRNCVHH